MRHDLSRHPELSNFWKEQMAEALLALGDPEAALRILPGSSNLDLAAETMHRIAEQRGIPWRERDARARGRVFGALLRRGKPQEGETLARRVLSEDPNDQDALRGILLCLLAQNAKRDAANGILLAGESVPPFFPFDLFTVSPQVLDAKSRLLRVGFLAEASCDKAALQEAGALLAEDPGNRVAFEIYGEIVVRRKLGLTEFEWPRVDWSSVRR
jgi:hypothetical protein